MLVQIQPEPPVGPVAQWSERLPHKQLVAGSNLGRAHHFQKAISSAGRALLLQGRGHPFDPDIAYQFLAGVVEWQRSSLPS
jgi:hypothetical protein